MGGLRGWWHIYHIDRWAEGVVTYLSETHNMRAYTYYSVEYLILSIKYWISTSGYTIWLHISTIDHRNPKPGNWCLMFDTQYHELNIRYSKFNIWYYGREMPQKCNCHTSNHRVPSTEARNSIFNTTQNSQNCISWLQWQFVYDDIQFCKC
jgi:hypothetical protein